jgi:ferredoxin-NADP reductase
MAPCEVILKARKTLCDGTSAFYLERPSHFEFKAGQFANFTLLEPAEIGPEGNTRSLSLASAPYEKDLMVAMRMRNTAFKRALGALPAGARILLQGPFGNLTLHGGIARPAVLLAGGIGITPFRSMIWQAAEGRSPHRIVLFYSVRRPEEAAFLDELQEMEYFNPRYRFIPTVTEPHNAGLQWRGEIGRITHEMLAKYIVDLKEPIYYIAGPPAMVAGMRQFLESAGVTDHDIRAEEFYGYS